MGRQRKRTCTHTQTHIHTDTDTHTHTERERERINVTNRQQSRQSECTDSRQLQRQNKDMFRHGTRRLPVTGRTGQCDCSSMHPQVIPWHLMTVEATSHPTPTFWESNAFLRATVGVVSATVGTMSFFTLCEYTATVDIACIKF